MFLLELHSIPANLAECTPGFPFKTSTSSPVSSAKTFTPNLE